MKNADRSDLPEYHSHKVVRAAKIVGHEFEGEAKSPVPGQRNLVHIQVGDEVRALLPGEEFWRRWQPFRGLSNPDDGYYVLYADGFESWSPTKAFEDGYQLSADTDALREELRIERERKESWIETCRVLQNTDTAPDPIATAVFERDEARAALAAAQERERKLTEAGRPMANYLYNVRQREGVDPRDYQIMGEMVDGWDAAPKWRAADAR